MAALGAPRFSFLIGEFAITLLLMTGPIAVSMALLKRWLRTPWALYRHAFVTTFVYRQEVLFGEAFGAYVALGFLGFVWFAWCFSETDLLATIVAMFVFNGVVGTWVHLRLNLDVNPIAFLSLLPPSPPCPALPWSACARRAAHDSAAVAAHS